jgi:transposase InsO family protein
MRASVLVGMQPSDKEALVGHPRAKLTLEGRRLLVERVLELGWTATTAAEAQGCSRATVHKWLRRFHTEGEAGLHDRSSRPRRSPRRLHSDQERAILERRAGTLEGPHRIGWALGVPRSTVHRVLRRHGVPRLSDLDRPTRTVVRYERDRPGELVHLDVKKLGRIPDGGGWRAHGREVARGGRIKRGAGYDYLHVALDDRSRVAYAEAHPDERAETAAAFAGRAIGFFASLGIGVERILTDNAFCYRSRAFQAVLAETGVSHRRTRPYRPQTNGKVERFNLTLKQEWAYVRPFETNQARLEELGAFLHRYNHHRPHTAHEGGTPMSAVNNVSGQHS